MGNSRRITKMTIVAAFALPAVIVAGTAYASHGGNWNSSCTRGTSGDLCIYKDGYSNIDPRAASAYNDSWWGDDHWFGISGTTLNDSASWAKNKKLGYASMELYYDVSYGGGVGSCINKDQEDREFNSPVVFNDMGSSHRWVSTSC